MIKNVFVDFHHAGLLQSFILFFEGRLGAKVYRPIGMDWATKGYWKVYDHPATQAQFLDINGATPDGTPILNKVVDIVDSNSLSSVIYSCQDIDSGQTNKAITFDGFMDMPFDIVIASLPQHIEPYKKLCELHPNKPKLIYQIGNQWDLPAGVPVKNIMASAKIPNIPADINFIQYHQEFDTTIFRPDRFTLFDFKEVSPLLLPGNNIYSFVNCFNIQSHFTSDWNLFKQVELQVLSHFTFRSYGGQCRDGAAHGIKQVADKMREARFIWHTKFGGDGYGHILFNSAAMGKPLITKKSYYAGKLGEDLMIDGETCINIDNLSVDQIIEKIRYFNQEPNYIEMSKNVYKNFKKHVDFSREAEELKAFLSSLK